jgi:hypothetical protein
LYLKKFAEPSVKHEEKGRKTGIHIKAEVTSSKPGENFLEAA